LAVLPEGAKLYPTPLSKTGIARTLAAQPEAIADARSALLGLGVPPTTLAKLALLVSELVTNSVRHAGLPEGASVQLQITHEGGRVRLAVRDGGRGFDPSALVAGGPLVVGGQGLVIVAALSDAWGVERHANGCTVWCEVAAEEAPAVEAERDDVTTGYVHELAIQMARPAALMPT
jgi:anti-sigma regulatory factor (Ser/Thr protein kinase)